MYESLLARLATAFKQANIPYMVIGGQAVLQYGEPRLTRDIDVTLGVDVDKLASILTLIRQNGLQPVVADSESFVKRTNVLPVSDGATGVRVDLMFSFSTYEQEAIRRAKPILVNDHHVYYASVEDVIIHKVVAGRPRDLDDIKGMLVRNKQYDRAYVTKWLKALGETLATDFIARLREIAQ